MPRRVVGKVEWHPGEIYPRVGFILTNLSRPAEETVSVARGYPAIRQDDSFRPILGDHPGNVG